MERASALDAGWDELCGSADEAPEPVDCLRQLWKVSIDGQPVSLATFVPAERADLKMRGLIGLVPLAGLPGRVGT